MLKNIKEVIAAAIKWVTNLTWVGSRFHPNEKSVTHAALCSEVYNRSPSALCRSCQEDFRANHRARCCSAFLINFYKSPIIKTKQQCPNKSFSSFLTEKTSLFDFTRSYAGKYCITRCPGSRLCIMTKGPAFSVLSFFSNCLKNLSVVWVFHHYIYMPLCILLSKYFRFWFCFSQNTG